MNTTIRPTGFSRRLLLLLALPFVAACAPTPATPALQPASEQHAAMPVATIATADRAASPQAMATGQSVWPRMTVHKSPTCGCCGAWISHMQEAGFVVDVHDHQDLGPIKAEMGVPYGKGSCHTAEVGGYLVEGHVPAEDIQRLLTEKPDIRGLVLPGMPAGSPGMEMPDGRGDPYTVEAVQADGSTRAYAHHGG